MQQRQQCERLTRLIFLQGEDFGPWGASHIVHGFLGFLVRYQKLF